MLIMMMKLLFFAAASFGEWWMRKYHLLSAARLPDAVKSKDPFDLDLLRLRSDGILFLPEG